VFVVIVSGDDYAAPNLRGRLARVGLPSTNPGVSVQSGPESRLALVRRYYEAYDNNDRSLIESVLHAGFTFSSPNNDDNIDQVSYFSRCWPNHEAIRHFDLLDVCADSEQALVRYHASSFDGAGFRNVEHFEFRDDLISHVDCYFGPPLPDQTTENWGAKRA
jgi:SnoaL-like domain